MKINYPLNSWYVAALGEELEDGLLARQLLGRRVVLFRTSSGEVAALDDRCAHRAFPLSKGHLDGDCVVCGYHGCVYDATGRLIEVPSQDNVPPNISVASYPVRESGPFVWIWLGDRGAAGLRSLPRGPFEPLPNWGETVEVFRVEANYLLLHEHYLDLTNVFLMYPEAAPPGIEALPQLDEVAVSELSVEYSRTLPRATLADWEAEATGLPVETECDRIEGGAFVSPGLHVQRYVITPASQPAESYSVLRMQGFTPETPTSTLVFLRLCRSFEPNRRIVSDFLRNMFHGMALRDAEVLGAVQSRLSEDPSPRRDLNVRADRAAVRARRIALSMVDDEARSRR